jgi:DNA replication protein DnaC
MMMVEQDNPQERLKNRLRSAGLDDVQLDRVIRNWPWTKDEFTEQRSRPEWEKRLHDAAVVLEKQHAAQSSVAYLGRLLVSAGPVALAERTTRQLVELCAKELRSEALTYDPFSNGGRLVCGPTGSGKTVAAVAVIRRLFAEPYGEWSARTRGWNTIRSERPACEVKSCIWARAFDLPNARLQCGLGQGEAEIVHSAKTSDFVVLDDLGWESKRANAEDVVIEVIAARYDSGKPTYVTSGLTVEGLISRYGDSVVRRIIDAGGKPGKVISLWREENK